MTTAMIIKAALIAILAMPTPAPIDKTHLNAKEVRCLAENIYFEARGDGMDSMIAVALVTKNRVYSTLQGKHKKPLYPKTYCGVVHQRTKRGCQFSWVCEKSHEVKNEKAFETAAWIAVNVISGRFSYSPFGATHYFNPDKVSPTWAEGMDYEGRVGHHKFYEQVAGR